MWLFTPLDPDLAGGLPAEYVSALNTAKLECIYCLLRFEDEILADLPSFWDLAEVKAVFIDCMKGTGLSVIDGLYYYEPKNTRAPAIKQIDCIRRALLRAREATWDLKWGPDANPLTKKAAPDVVV
jgi:hypothetical protein